MGGGRRRLLPQGASPLPLTIRRRTLALAATGAVALLLGGSTSANRCQVVLLDLARQKAERASDGETTSYTTMPHLTRQNTAEDGSVLAAAE
jgi:hypothetical protein